MDLSFIVTRLILNMTHLKCESQQPLHADLTMALFISMVSCQVQFDMFMDLNYS